LATSKGVIAREREEETGWEQWKMEMDGNEGLETRDGKGKGRAYIRTRMNLWCFHPMQDEKSAILTLF